MSIIDDTIQILASMNLRVISVETPPGFKGIRVDLPNDAQAFFVWAKIDKDDYAFRIARFWANENPFSMLMMPNLTEALARIRELARQ